MEEEEEEEEVEEGKEEEEEEEEEEEVHCFSSEFKANLFLHFGAKTFEMYSSVLVGLAGGAYKVTIYVVTAPSFLFTTA